MEKLTKVAVWYGVVVFLLTAYHFNVITSVDWNASPIPIVLHLLPVFVAMLIGTGTFLFLVLAFRRFPSMLDATYTISKIVGSAGAFGIAFFVCFAGIGMFSFMDASDAVLARAYRISFILSTSVAVLALPVCYRFYRRHGRHLSLDDLSPEI